jgi:putative transposase
MSLKTISSHRVRQHRWPEVQKALWGNHFWPPSYAVVSCSGAPLEHVKQYIRRQQTPEHQAKRERTNAP